MSLRLYFLIGLIALNRVNCQDALEFATENTGDDQIAELTTEATAAAAPEPPKESAQSPNEQSPPPAQSGEKGAPVPAGCSEQDHRSCDDVCKTDSFWYGYCASWDGRDFQCTCIAYTRPFEGAAICGPQRQEKCANECREKGQEAGGYCAVFPSAEDARGEPKCMCFDKPALN